MLDVVLDLQNFQIILCGERVQYLVSVFDETASDTDTCNIGDVGSNGCQIRIDATFDGSSGIRV